MIENCHLPAKRSKQAAGKQAGSKGQEPSAPGASHKQSKSHNQNKRIAIAIDSLLVASLE